MSSCVYNLKGHKFLNEYELDSFLLGNKDYLNIYKDDSIFSRTEKNKSNNKIITSEINPQARELRKKWRKTRYVDGEEIREAEKPYVGTLDYLSLVTIDGVRLFPEFIEEIDPETGLEGYWPRRVKHWTGEVEPDVNQPKWTDDEIELFFGGDAELAERTTLSTSDTDTINLYKLLMKKKWETQAKFGTSIHNVLKFLFSPTGSGTFKNAPKIFTYRNQSDLKLIDLINTALDKGLISGDGLDEKVIRQTITYAKNLLDTIRDTVCIDLDINEIDFYPEIDISARLTDSPESKNKYILGTIDLLVVDRYGNIHIFDYKTSPKLYEEYADPKKQTFLYLLETYRHILNAGKVDTNLSTINILPIQLLGFKLNNPDDAFNIEKDGDTYKGVKDAQFSYSGISYETGSSMIKNLDEVLVHRTKVSDNVDTFLPLFNVVKLSTAKITRNTQANMKKWFSGNEAVGWTDEGLMDLIKEKGADKPEEDGKYHYRSEALFMRDIVADTEVELISALRKEMGSLKNKMKAVITNTVKAIDNGIKGEPGGFIIPNRTYDEHAILEWSEDIFHRYLNGCWERQTGDDWDSLLNTYGLIVLRNKVTGEFDFIKLSVNNLKDNRVFGKHMLRKYLTGGFQSDEQVESDTNNHALPAVQGFVEAMEVMSIINNMADSLPEGSVVGRVQVINPFHGLGLSATNELLRWNYDKFIEHYGLNEGETDFITIQNPPVKFLKGYELAYLMLREVLSEESQARTFKKKVYKTHIYALDQAIKDANKDVAIEKLLAIAKQMELDYGYLKTLSKGSAAEAKSRAIYNQVLIGIANLLGIDFDVQVKDHDKWLENKGIKSIVNGGVTGTYIDNPGNLSSDTLNLITKLVTESYLLVRLDMVEPKTKIRELLTKLKEEKGYSKFRGMMGDWRQLYGNMYREEEDEIYFKNPYTDTTLTDAEREFLLYAIPEFIRNKPKSRYSDEEIEKLMRLDKLEVFKAPLAKASVSADVAEFGILLSFKNRLKLLDPRHLVTTVRTELSKKFNDMVATATGDFLDLQVSDTTSSGDSTLFEMNNMFDQGDDPLTRRLALKRHGVYYFEHDLESLLLKYEYSASLRKRINAVFPTIKAAMIYLAKSGWELNTSFTNDLKYLEDYINANIKNKNIWANTEEKRLMAALSNEMRKIASFMTLAFSPVLFTYLSFQGLLLTISIYLRKPDGGKYSFHTFMKAFRIVYADLFHYEDNPSKLALINELYSINDMDMNVYTEHLKQDLTGFTNFAYKFASRPDYYNRMWIIVTKMLEDGTYDAIDVKDGKLVYDWTKDERYSAFARGDKSDLKKYREQKALYAANYKLFKAEGAELGPLDLENPVPLPLPYTNLEMESIKSICDLVYGYYTHEKKSLVHSLWLGSFFMQMRTYWSGKKNQYLAPGGVKLLGEWQQLTNDAGEKLYYQIIDGVVRTDLPPTTTVTDVPFVLWKGKFQEGIILTLAVEYQAAMENIRDFGVVLGVSKTFLDLKNAEDWETYYRKQNLKQLGYDTISYMLFGMMIANALRARSKELKLLAKDSGNIGDAMFASLMYIGYRTVSNAASDFNFLDGILSPVTVSVTPFSFQWWGNEASNIYLTLFGDRTFIQGLTNTMSVTKLFKPVFDTIDKNIHE